MNNFGKTKIIKYSISDEYNTLVLSDKESANVLYSNGLYRQASYFIIQAMEKLIRAKIFTLVDYKNKYFREKNRTHSLNDSIELLIDIVSRGDILIRTQHKNNINNFILGNINYQRLHNNLRYPWYYEKYQSFNTLIINKENYLELQNKFFLLEKYIKDLY